MRFLWIGLVGVALAGVVSAEPPVVKKSRKISNNHNSYTYHDNRQRSRAPRATSRAASTEYAEINVQAPSLQAVPAAAPPPAAMPAPQPVAVQSYSQQHNPGPSQLPANRSASFSSSIYNTGPIWGPWGNGFYNGYNYGPGFYNNGFYNNGFNTGFPGGGFYNQCNSGQGVFFSSGFNVNLTPQRFNPGPGEHPNSIQMPRPR